MPSNLICSQVNLFNRIDCCWDRLWGATVYIGDGKDFTYCGTVPYGGFRIHKYEIDCPRPINGQYVRVTGVTVLTLCEVQVFAEEGEDKIHHKGFVILNLAGGGWSRGEGFQKYLETCFRGVENFLHFF